MASVHLQQIMTSEPSEDSTSSSSHPSFSVTNPKKTIKHCCRKIVTFMCTQVGVGGLIVGYAVMGAFGFPLLENGYQNPRNEGVLIYTNITLERLWNITQKYNVLENELWNSEVLQLLIEFQGNVTKSVKDGYTGGDNSESEWTFPATLMFCLSIFTMIGYGNMVPRTVGGKVATIVYAVFGIPLYILYFKNMGKVLAQTFRWTYTWIYRCSMEDSHPKTSKDPPRKRVIVPSTACLWVLFAYVAIGTTMFSSWQNWSVMDSAYFCVTSLCKIGIGDFAPDHIFVPTSGGTPTRLIFTFVYLLFGMGIIAMCFDLMKEDVTVKVRNLRNDIVLFFEDIQSRAVDFYKRRNSFDYD